jgi:hypothetical protein
VREGEEGGKGVAISKELLIPAIATIIGQYSGMKLTVRQIYYRLVAAQLIENNVSSYQRIVKVLGYARRQGLISYDSIEDRTRAVHSPEKPIETPEAFFNKFYNALQYLDDYYTIPKWYGQKDIVQVWVEKEALSSLFRQVTDVLGVDLVVCRGYPSLTLLHEASERLLHGFDDHTDSPNLHIVYFGDFDPSGADIQRNVDEVLDEDFDVDVDLERKAITREQIDFYNIPPAPAKKSDSRYNGFVEREGVAWQVELDAIEPRKLQGIIRTSVNHFYDSDIATERDDELERRKALMAGWSSKCLDKSFKPPKDKEAKE